MNIGFLTALSILTVSIAAGCGGGDPLGIKHRPGAETTTAAKPVNDLPNTPTESVSPLGIPAPTLIEETPAQAPGPQPSGEPKYVETKPGTLPDDLAEVIQKAADALSKEDKKTALGLLVDPKGLPQDLTVEAIAEKMPKFNVILLEGTLRQAFKTPPRLTEDGNFALFELSDSSHARFRKIDGHWRLSENRGPDADTPGVRYDDAPAHAAFLLRKLGRVESLDDGDLWSEAERPAVAALRRDGAGLARGRNPQGAPVTAVVIPEKFAAGDDSFARVKQIDGLQIVGIYVAPVSETALASLASLPNLQCIRLLRPLVTDSTIEALAKCRRLKTLSIGATQPSAVHLAPLASLTALERLELTSLAFGKDDLSHLNALSKLRRLDLSFSTVDDQSLASLQSLMHLEQLMIRGTQVTAEGLIPLRAAVPNLFVDW